MRMEAKRELGIRDAARPGLWRLVDYFQLTNFNHAASLLLCTGRLGLANTDMVGRSRLIGVGTIRAWTAAAE
jgi:hypothetical protein